MKKTAILFLSLASPLAMLAQSKIPLQGKLSNATEPAKMRSVEPRAESSVTYWSEDFANGIPSTWSQNGTPGAALWEYRGTGGQPVTVGSRGAFATGLGPINSSTASNGFVIFDSDYLDNGGNPSNMGSGPAPTPHIGRLITGVIDLSTQPLVELKLESYARVFFSDFYIAFSTDGGLTYNDTLQLYDDLAVNQSTDNVQETAVNVSSIIGGQSNVKMQFIFAGNTPGNTNGTGYYFWMIDDIELRSLPDNELRLTALPNAPAIDMLYGPTGSGYAKYGYMHNNQIVPVSFDANLYNYGALTQTNTALEVEIWDANSLSIVTTLTTTGCATLSSGDTCDFNNLTTAQWTPPSTPADYIIVYKVISDLISSANTTDTDTILFFVSDRTYSLDRNINSGSVGTNSANPEITAMGVTYNLDNEDPDSTGSGLVFLDGINIAFTGDTDSTADIEIAIYDTTGFAFNAGFPANAQPIYSRIFDLGATSPAGAIRVTFPFFTEDSLYNPATQTWTEANNPLAVAVGDYFVIVTFFPNAVDGVVRVINDETMDQPGEASVMQLADGNWFSGFTSRAFEAPHMRLLIADAPAYDISVKENDLNNFSVYPNPTSGLGNIQFAIGGTYSIRVIDMVGNVVANNFERVNANEKVSLDLSTVPAGVYLVTVEGEGLNKTVKLTVQ